MERVTEVTKDCFDAVIQIRKAETTAAPSPETLQHRLRTAVDEMLRRAAVLGFSHQDAQDMAYALVALMDEVMLGKPGNYRQFWMGNLLQQRYFNENTAGDNFFTRLEAVRKDTQRTETLQVFYLCMLFGFQGRYRIRGGELELLSLIDAVQKELARARSFDFDKLSPHGERPNEAAWLAGKRLSFLSISLAAMGLALVVYAGLFLGLSNTTKTLLSDVKVHVAGQTRDAR